SSRPLEGLMTGRAHGRARRSRLGTLAFLAVIAASGAVAWKLLGDEGGARKHAATPRANTGPFTSAGTGSRPASLPASRPGAEALVLAPEPGSIRGRVTDRGSIPVNHATV